MSLPHSLGRPPSRTPASLPQSRLPCVTQRGPALQNAPAQTHLTQPSRAHSAHLASPPQTILCSLTGPHPRPGLCGGPSQMAEDVLKLGKERQHVVFPLLSAERRRVAGCVGSKPGGDPAGGSRLDWEHREESSGDSLGGPGGWGPKQPLPVSSLHPHGSGGQCSQPDWGIRLLYWSEVP